MKLLGPGFFFVWSVPEHVVNAGFSFVVEQFGVSAMLAMAPLVCTYASRRTQRIMALALGGLALFPFASITRPAVQPFEVLVPYLLSYLNVTVSVAGLLVSAVSFNRKATALGEAAELPEPESQGGALESTSSWNNSPLGSSLCWVALAHFLAPMSLPLAFPPLPASEAALMLIYMYFLDFPFVYSLLAMAPLVCAFSGPVARRIFGVLLALQVLLRLRGNWLFWRHELPEFIALTLIAAVLLSMDVLPRRKRRILPSADQPKDMKRRNESE
jgi:hypothetical protein